MPDYVTSTSLATYMGITVNTDRADATIEAVESEVNAYCTRVDFQQTTSTVSLEGTFSRTLNLPGGPVASVASVSIDGTTLNGSDYEVHPHKLVRVMPGESSFAGVYGNSLSWGGPWRRVTVNYTHGFSTVPELVVNIVLRASARAYVNPEQRRDVTLETGHRVVHERMAGVFLTAGDLMQLRNAGFRWEADNVRR